MIALADLNYALDYIGEHITLWCIFALVVILVYRTSRRDH